MPRLALRLVTGALPALVILTISAWFWQTAPATAALAWQPQPSATARPPAQATPAATTYAVNPPPAVSGPTLSPQQGERIVRLAQGDARFRELMQGRTYQVKEIVPWGSATDLVGGVATFTLDEPVGGYVEFVGMEFVRGADSPYRSVPYRALVWNLREVTARVDLRQEAMVGLSPELTPGRFMLPVGPPNTPPLEVYALGLLGWVTAILTRRWRLVAALPLFALALTVGWYGALLVYWEFTRAYKDTPYWALGAIVLLLAALLFLGGLRLARPRRARDS